MREWSSRRRVWLGTRGVSASTSSPPRPGFLGSRARRRARL